MADLINEMLALPGIDLLSLKDSLRIRKHNNTSQVLDPLRKKYIRCTPEETVRQLWLIYLLETARINPKLIAIERAFKADDFTRRFDLVIFDRSALPVLLAEFKSPEITVKQSAFDQIARYNMKLHVPYSLISNGAMHYCFRIDKDEKKFVWQEKLPF